MGETDDAARRRAELLELCSHLRLELSAASSDPSRPAFVAPPPGSPPYHGFEVPDVAADGSIWLRPSASSG